MPSCHCRVDHRRSNHNGWRPETLADGSSGDAARSQSHDHRRSDHEDLCGSVKKRRQIPVLVQFIPISERTQGSGRFGACYLERWDATSHRWVYIPAAVMSLESVPVRSSTLNGGDAIDVCGRPSAEELGQSGPCYRFTLQVQLKGSTSPSILSRTFKVGTQTEGIAQNANRDAVTV